MNRTEFMRHLAIMLPRLVAAIVLGIALTATYLRNAPLPWRWMDLIRAEVRGACELPDGHWMTVALVAIYLFGFAALRWRQSRLHSDKVGVRTRLALMLVLAGGALVSYLLNYDTAAGSTDLLVLLSALAVGQGFAFWFGWEVSAGRSTAGLRLFLLRVLAVVLALASLLHPSTSQKFQYRGQVRWVGIWDNPNVFGALMAIGVILAAGLLLASLLRLTVGISPLNPLAPKSQKCEEEDHVLKPGAPKATYYSAVGARLFPWLTCALWLMCFMSSSIGLLFSYSRGAWLGAGIGIGWLGWQVLRIASATLVPARSWLLLLRRCLPAFVLLTVSSVVIGFWSLRYTETPLLRRVFTVGNPNDLSWRNRVDTWPGALEAIARRPLTGWGWNRLTAVYEHGHRPTWLSESGALRLNDYLILGMNLGVLVVLAFFLWIALAWPFTNTMASLYLPAAICHLLSTCLLPRASLIPLLLAFALDGGLFKLNVAILFSLLLELTAFPCEG